MVRSKQHRAHVQHSYVVCKMIDADLPDELWYVFRLHAAPGS